MGVGQLQPSHLTSLLSTNTFSLTFLIKNIKDMSSFVPEKNKKISCGVFHTNTWCGKAGEKWNNSVVVSPKSPQQAGGCPRLYFCFSQAAKAQAPPPENHFSNIGQTPHSAGNGGGRSRLVEAASEKWAPC